MVALLCLRTVRAILFAFGAVYLSAALAGSATYLYDSLGRLTQVTYSNGTVIKYAYDSAGNRTSTVITGAP
jgi:YD repeat-containing protein